MNKRHSLTRVVFPLFVFILITTGPAAAQGGSTARTLRVLQDAAVPVRDVIDLAERLGGLPNAGDITVTPAPAYAVGDRKTFFVGHSEDDAIFEVEAELAAAAPGVYLWVAAGVPYDSALLARIATYLDNTLFPEVRALFGQEASPGIDGDPHIYILNTTGIGRTIGGYFNDSSVYPRAIFDSSNEHEMFVVAVDNVPFSSMAYLYVLAHEFVHMIQHNQDENEETWVSEGTAELGAFLTVSPQINAAQRYLMNPASQLNTWDIDSPGIHYGSSALFFSYLVERFGPDIVRLHSHEQADGINGISNTLAALGATDPQTGAPIQFADVFADWLAANLLDDTNVGDGRFAYTELDLQGLTAAHTRTFTDYPVHLNAAQVNQHGATYLRLESETPQTLQLTFEGAASVPIVPADAHSGSGMYWANRSDQSNPRLTRRFDLSQVDSATLSFWTWFEMEPFWDFGYLSISTDSGQTWQPLETSATTRENPHNRAFAPGFTGFSASGTADIPAPCLGLSYDPNSGTVLGVQPDSGAATSGLLPGDRLLAIDSIVLLNPADLAARLEQYRVDDTVLLTILRDDLPLEIAVTLGEHPQRTVRPSASWVLETVDLTPVVGGDVLVRFDFVTDQAFTRNGWLLDDISIPEIGFFDDAEAAGIWQAEGWVQITNELPQDFLVETASEDSGVERVLMPGEGHSVTWTVNVGPDVPATIIISGMAQYTVQPATYSLHIDPVS